MQYKKFKVSLKLKMISVFSDSQWDLELFLNTTYIIDTSISAATCCRFNPPHEKEYDCLKECCHVK